jgi:predicted nucleotidyltransferase
VYASFDRYDLLNRLVDALASDPRIGGVWLEGSLARGDADHYSDVDLHAYVPYNSEEESCLAQVQDSLPDLLSSAGRIVYLRTLPGTSLTTGVMEDGSRFDFLLETEEDLKRPRRAVKVLHDPGGELWTRLRFTDNQEEIDGSRVEAAVREFWRCLGLLPVVVGRGELIVAFQGHALMVGLGSDILLASRGVPPPSEAKRLNPYLDAEDRAALEEALPAEPTLRAIAGAQLRLAMRVSKRGRDAAADFAFEYPKELERAVMGYVSGELRRFGFSDLLPNVNLHIL